MRGKMTDVTVNMRSQQDGEGYGKKLRWGG
jgi:hypothetical protein